MATLYGFKTEKKVTQNKRHIFRRIVQLKQGNPNKLAPTFTTR